MTTDKILDKVQKLLAKAESAEKLGSLEEAEAFAVKAQQILFNNKLDDKDLEAFIKEKGEAGLQEKVVTIRFNPSDWGLQFKRRRTAWEQRLAGEIARAHMCRHLVSEGSNFIWFVGFKEDAQFALELYARLLGFLQKESQRVYDREYNKLYDYGYSTESMRGFKNSWVIGAVTGIANKLKAQRIQAEQATKGTGLIVLTENAVNEYVKKNYGKASGHLGGRSDFNRAAYQKGVAFGQAHNLRPELKK